MSSDAEGNEASPLAIGTMPITHHPVTGQEKHAVELPDQCRENMSAPFPPPENYFRPLKAITSQAA